jgi:hypothetical protein
METVFKVSFPTAFIPEYKRGLTNRISPLKKDPVPLRLCILNVAP